MVDLQSWSNEYQQLKHDKICEKICRLSNLGVYGCPNFRMPMDAPFQAELLSVERPAAEEAERLMARLVTQLLPRWLEDWRVDLPEAKMDPKKVDLQES